LPVIVTDAMGPKELTRDGVDGFVTQSETDFAEKVSYLIKNKTVCRSMGRSARWAINDRSWKSVFTDLVGYYRMTLKNNKSNYYSVDNDVEQTAYS